MSDAEKTVDFTADREGMVDINVSPNGSKKGGGDSKDTGSVLMLTGYGGYNKLKVQQESIPSPKENELVINMKACGLNFAELMGRQGLYDRFPKPPCVMGFEGAGDVYSVGTSITDFKVGDRVCVIVGHGSWREYLCVEPKYCFKIPDKMSFVEAAAIPVNYLTAYLMLFDFGNLRPNKSVLVHMAAGGVGCAVAQLCSTVSNVTVFGTASSGKHEFIKKNGITHPIDYRTQNYVDEIRKISPQGVDIILDPLLGKDAIHGYNLLKPMGKIIHFGAANMVSGEGRNLMQVVKTWWNTANVNLLNLCRDNKSVCGFHLGYLATEQDLLRECLSHIFKLYEEGVVKPIVHGQYSFQNVGKAMAEMHERRNVGKVVLIPNESSEKA